MAAPSAIAEVREAHADYARAARRNRAFALGKGLGAYTLWSLTSPGSGPGT